jgi:hypothetical protein
MSYSLNTPDKLSKFVLHVIENPSKGNDPKVPDISSISICDGFDFIMERLRSLLAEWQTELFLTPPAVHMYKSWNFITPGLLVVPPP